MLKQELDAVQIIGEAFFSAYRPTTSNSFPVLPPGVKDTDHESDAITKTLFLMVAKVSRGLLTALVEDDGVVALRRKSCLYGARPGICVLF